MPEVTVRFAVFGADGRSSDIWKVWANVGTGRRDIYMTSRPLGYSMKLSLHETGQWHVGFHADRRDLLFDEGCAPQSRFLGQWNAAPRRNEQPVTLAARVVFPWSCPTVLHEHLPVDLVRIPNAPERLATEVALVLLDFDEPADSWVGQRSMGTSLVGRVPLDGGGEATLVYRTIEMPQDMPARQGNPQFFAGRSREDLQTANRFVAWGQAEDGSICFMEAPLEVHIPPIG
jgi:hypothetical protein